MIKIFKLAALASLMVVVSSCQERLPEDQSDRFAANVVSDLHKTALQQSLSDISIIHKASTWFEAESESARHEIEDLYFSKVAPRAKEGEITLIVSIDEIPISHNNISVTQAGAKWSISANDSFSQKKITVCNIDGKQWECTLEEPNGEVSYSFIVEWSEIDKYIVTLDGRASTVYANSPVVGQHFFTTSKLAVEPSSVAPYSLLAPLSIIDGTLTIELLSEGGVAIPNDNIEVEFFSSDEQTSPYYDYGYNGIFNPLINFRGKSFYYTDIYGYFFYE